mmetsp:Transcript_3686/g.8586  ORF Transcript_3686/g.8586 Transcript_3686/m.8586 type:complete len:292 (+) Transcript_3686:102-977(+)
MGLRRVVDWARPHVLRGAASTLFTPRWKLSSILDSYGDAEITVQRLPSCSAHFPEGTPFTASTTVKTFASCMQPSASDPLLYWSSQVLYEPPFDSLLKEFRRPCIMQDAGDFLSRWRCLRFVAPPMLRFIFYFRWLFIGPAGSYSRLHLDPAGSAAWNACLEGRKRFVFFEPQFMHNLHIDLSNPQKERHIYPDYIKDAGILGQPYEEFCLDPGDVMYAPPRWPHFVENLEPSVSVTENFVRSHPDQFLHFDEALASSEASSALLPSGEKRRLKRFRNMVRMAASFDDLLT